MKTTQNNTNENYNNFIVIASLLFATLVSVISYIVLTYGTINNVLILR